jgi:hypothetical protein
MSTEIAVALNVSSPSVWLEKVKVKVKGKRKRKRKMIMKMKMMRKGGGRK